MQFLCLFDRAIHFLEPLLVMSGAAEVSVIPSMGVMALVRNLRNFDTHGISPAAVETVLGRITDADTPLRGITDAELRAAVKANLRSWASEARRQADFSSVPADLNPRLHTMLVTAGADQYAALLRDIARKFNAAYGETFPETESVIRKDVGRIIGLDGEAKMSKSLDNTIPVLAEPDAVWAKVRL